jgi:hypothetical protein
VVIGRDRENIQPFESREERTKVPRGFLTMPM